MLAALLYDVSIEFIVFIWLYIERRTANLLFWFVTINYFGESSDLLLLLLKEFFDVGLGL